MRRAARVVETCACEQVPADPVSGFVRSYEIREMMDL
jgi:hypothetical protein